MGGYGSGRRVRKLTLFVEHIERLDAESFKQPPAFDEGALQTRTRETLVEINGRTHGLRIETTPANFGGARAWFRCGQCDKRVRYLYVLRDAMECRVCAELRYQTQWCGSLDRALNRARKHRRRLGASEDLTKPVIPLRPPRMHQSTFVRLLAASKTADADVWRAAAECLAGEQRPLRSKERGSPDVAGFSPGIGELRHATGVHRSKDGLPAPAAAQVMFGDPPTRPADNTHPVRLTTMPRDH